MSEEQDTTSETTTATAVAEATSVAESNLTKAAVPSKRKKGKKNILFGSAYVRATFNNTIVSIADDKGNIIAQSSAGAMGYSGAKKGTPYVAGLIAGSVAAKARAVGMQDINVYVKGIGSGRESAVRALQSSGLNITTIKDVTPLPHNGCRRPRARRV